MIRAVIFDLDDTLMDHSGAMKQAVSDFFDHLARPAEVTLDDFQRIWSEELERYHQKYLDREITFAQQRILRVQAVYGRLGRSVSETEAGELFRFYLQAYEKRWRLFPDAARCLAGLHGCRLGVVSNGDSQHQRKKLKHIGVLHRFDSVVISGDTGVSKPDPRIFSRSLAQLGVDACEALFAGDDYERDYLGAARAGLHACLLDRSGDTAFKPVEGGFIINTLLSLEKVIQSYNRRTIDRA